MFVLMNFSLMTLVHPAQALDAHQNGQVVIDNDEHISHKEPPKFPPKIPTDQDMNKSELTLYILLPILAFLFLVSMVITFRNQRARAEERHRNWIERYGTRNGQHEENVRRVFKMFGVEERDVRSPAQISHRTPAPPPAYGSVDGGPRIVPPPMSPPAYGSVDDMRSTIVERSSPPSQNPSQADIGGALTAEVVVISPRPQRNFTNGPVDHIEIHIQQPQPVLSNPSIRLGERENSPV